ncbi:glycosyltransferase family protein [Yinghuangia seranimata]|uniref:glycosyltransferase family protein n=1 Tax=Yinghuangia seranimata TaxID=408067 RepID=UPI00248C8B1C|nr:glycosyltransferase [Yinghuangia seranimata]MDI2132268.1 glycosyltransferase [Yinghuangia seranimata]
MTRLRVLYAPRDIAGQPSTWARGLRALGVHAEVWSFGEPAFGLVADRVWDADRLLADPAYRWEVLDRAVRGFDVVHLQYGRSLLNAHEPLLPALWDVPLLRSLGKKVFMHWHGSDVRLRSVHMEREPDSYLKDAVVDEARIHAMVEIARRYCDRMFVSTPGLLDYVPDAELVPLAIDPAQWATARGTEPAVPVVVHLPSKRATKGSHLVDAALRPLDAEGVVAYRPLSGLSRAEVAAEFARADIVVDSLTIGDHGMVAVEAMACGAIAVAHVHERNRARTPGCPVVEAVGADLADVVRALAADPDERARLREESVAWVAKRHDVGAVARQLLAAYREPPVPVVADRPDWPLVDGRGRVTALEAEISRLRQALGRHGARAATVPPRSARARVEDRPRLHLLVRRLDALRRRLRAAVRTQAGKAPKNTA